MTKLNGGRLWYRIEPSTGMPLVGLDGAMSFEEWELIVESALGDPMRRPGRMLSDRRHMAGAPTVAFVDQIVRFFDHRKDELGPTRWAVLTAEHDAVYGMVRMAQVLAEQSQVQVQAFTRLRPALAWLLEHLEGRQQTAIGQWVERCVAEESRDTTAV